MKRTALLLLLTLFAFFESNSQDTIYSIAYTSTASRFFDLDDRDTANYFFADTSNSLNTWKIGRPSKVIFDSAYSAPLALVTDTLAPYPPNNLSRFFFTVFSDDATRIDFWHRMHSDSLSDGGLIEVSTDGGATWTNILLATQFTLTNFYSSGNTIASNGNNPGFTGHTGWTNSII